MKKTKIIIFFVTALCLVFCLGGCGAESDKDSLKDNLIDGWNNLMQSFSRHALTKDRDLKGDKENGIDEYTGNYTAEYDDFNGEEFIFGGTALERDNGSNLKATYTLSVSSGQATLYWLSAGEEHMISDKSADDIFSFTICSGDNYIVLKGENFSGSLELIIDDDDD